MRPGEGGAYAVDGIIDKPKDVTGKKVNAGDDGHRSIDELALVVALNVFLNRPMKSREVINKPCQPLVSNDPLISRVEIPQHPWVRKNPTSLIPPEVIIHNLHLRHPRSHLTEREEKDLLRVDSIPAGSTIHVEPCGNGDLVRHRLKLTLEIKQKQLIQTTELAVIEMRHLQRSHVG